MALSSIIQPQVLLTRSANGNQWLLLLIVFCFVTLSYVARRWYRLAHIPGPFLASLTDFERARWVLTKRAHLIHQELHKKYGEVVRIGPNTVIFENPEAIPTVYPTKPGFPKSDFYAALRPYSKDSGSLQVVFNTQDEDLHKQIKNPIAPLFSLTAATSFEPLVDGVLQFLDEKLRERFARSGKVFNLGDYCQFYAFDVMGTMTFSRRHGFLDQGTDVNNMIGALHKFMETVGPMTQMPIIDKILYKNRFADYIRRGPGLRLLQLAGKAIQQRREDMVMQKTSMQSESAGPRDFLSRFIEAQDTNPTLPPWASTAWTFSNIVAGSDSVGTVTRTVMFHLLTNPATLDKLHEELTCAKLAMPYPKFSEVRDLPYLEACIQEGIRMHPPFALALERVVPKGGISMLGHYLPEGTKVGGSPYAVNRHKGTFGDDAETWRPERWLNKSENEKRKLENSMLTFGAGRRVCLGKHIGLLEIKKFIPFLLLNYKVHIVNPEGFTVENIWFFKQEGLLTKIQERSHGDAGFSQP